MEEKEWLGDLLSEGEVETMTLAPESGSFSARIVLGKGLSNQEWIELIEELLERGDKKGETLFYVR